MSLKDRIIELHDRGATVESISKMVGDSTLLVTFVLEEGDRKGISELLKARRSE